MSRLSELRNHIEREKGRKMQIASTIKSLNEEITQTKRSLKSHEYAREIIREVGLKTQQQLQYNISDIVSLALDSIFPDPYQLKVDFVLRRNKTECDLKFTRGDLEIEPIEASGVGAIDVAAFALRIASWSMLRPKVRNTIILDEPFRYLSINYQPAASAMIKEISNKLGIQFIIVTHEETLTEAADKVFEVSINRKGRSVVK